MHYLKRRTRLRHGLCIAVSRWPLATRLVRFNNDTCTIYVNTTTVWHGSTLVSIRQHTFCISHIRASYSVPRARRERRTVTRAADRRAAPEKSARKRRDSLLRGRRADRPNKKYKTHRRLSSKTHPARSHTCIGDHNRTINSLRPPRRTVTSGLLFS